LVEVRKQGNSKQETRVLVRAEEMIVGEPG